MRLSVEAKRYIRESSSACRSGSRRPPPCCHEKSSIASVPLRDVARRLLLGGFLAASPDGSPRGALGAADTASSWDRARRRDAASRPFDVRPWTRWESLQRLLDPALLPGVRVANKRRGSTRDHPLRLARNQR